MNNPSLIKAADQQLKLFSSDQMPDALFAAEESAEQREYTGARLFAADPERYRSIVALSAEGLGVLRIARILHVGPNTVLAVRAREPEVVDIEKRRIAGLSREGAKMCVEGIIELLCDPVQKKKMTIKDLGIVFGILAEKHELLSGSPTARIQSVSAAPAEDLMEYLSRVKAEYERRSQIGLGEEKEGEKGDVEVVVGPDEAQAQGPIALLEAPGAPEDSIGQTPHRIAETTVNIDRNEGAENGPESISKADFIKG
ncbi:MAG: hypothetical protein WC329_02890 [Candidatus Omnitrophota bacterium]